MTHLSAKYESGPKPLARSSLVVSFLTGFSTLAGFLSQVVIAFLFGTSGEMDTFLAVSGLPMAIIGLWVAGFGFVLIPALQARREDEEKFWNLVNGVWSVVVIGGGLLAFGAWLGGERGGRVLLEITAPGLSGSGLARASELVPWVWGVVALNIVSSFLIGWHHFKGSFVWPAVAPLCLPIGMMVGGWLGAPWVGIKGLVLGQVAGTACQLALLLPRLWKEERWRWVPVLTVSRDVLALLFSLGGAAVSLLPFTALAIIDVYWVSRLPEGSLSYLGYATRIAVALTGVIVQGIAVVSFPALARHAALQEVSQWGRLMVKSMRMILLVAVPAAVVVGGWSGWLVEGLFQRGNFNEHSTVGLGKVLPYYATGMVAMALMSMLSRGFYSLQDWKTPVVMGGIALAGYGALSGWLITKYSFEGIGMAYAVYWIALAIASAVWLGKKIGGFWGMEDWWFVGKVAVGMAAALGMVSYAPFPPLVCAALAPAIFFGLARFVLKIEEASKLIEVIRGRSGS